MLINFSPKHYEKYYYAVVGRGMDGYLIKDNNSHIIENLLCQNFVSIQLEIEKSADISQYNYIRFYFTDPADEAFFLIWSSDGIEL